VGMLKNMKNHLMADCVQEKLRPLLLSMKEKIESQQKEIESLRMQLKEKEDSSTVTE
jgi:hypothetical protein